MNIIIIFIIAVVAGAAASPAGDSQALIIFKNGITADASGKLSTWSSGSSLCTAWFGVYCDIAGNVAGLVLNDLGLAGDLNLAALAGISALKNLSLAGNGFTGGLPASLDGLLGLEVLDLSNNRLDGPIPVWILSLSGISYLNLSVNGFSQEFPRGLQGLQQLRVLDLSYNGIWGDIGVLISELQYVERVNLSSNNFTGSLLVNAGDLTGLGDTIKYLNLSYNKVSGGFFSSDVMQVLKSLQVLDVTGNQLNGQLPPFDLVFSLKVFRAAGNKLSGPIPGGLLGSVLQLLELDLSGNGFSGSISSIDSSTLNYLNLSMNTLSGPLPSGLKTCISVDLSNNMITGDLSIIEAWGNTLQYIDLSSNQLSGEYPNQVTQFMNVRTIKIRNNYLTGSLPSVLGNFSELMILDLSLNQLTGDLLPSFFTSLNLTSLNLAGNQLSGVIPLPTSQSTESLVLPSYTHLASLDLSNNLLTGPLPSEIGNFQSLQMLNLRNNSLSGELPSELGKLDSLKYLDLSINHFKGRLPDLPQSELAYFNVSYNDLSGTIPLSLQRFPSSSFYPGNSLLVSSGGIPGGNNEKGKHHLKSSVRVAFIIGSIGAVVLVLFVIMMLYIIRTQDLCGNRFKGTTIRSELKFGRFGCPNMFRSPKDNHGPNSLSFSDHHLLKPTSRSMSTQKELLTENVGSVFSDGKGATESSMVEKIEHYPATTRDKSLLGPPLPTSPHVDACLSEQPVILDVCSPDRLIGELFFLENTLFFTAEELSRAPAEVLGRSSHGTSYKASLDSGHMLTVKWLRVGIVKNKKEFAKEAKKIGTIKHPNVIPWRAYYWGPREQERLIIADYVDGDSLGLYLYESTPRRYSRLSVSQRLKIAIDMAGCLSYLHNEKGLPHGSLKPSNVLLTGPDLTARLTDYGLHRLMTQNGIAEHILNLGALGYRPPELANCTKPLPTFKADVYAFGVVLMELLTRRSAGDIISGQSGAVDLTDWVQKCNREGQGPNCFDRDIAGLEEAPSVMDQLLAISLRCILPVNERPNIRTVYEDLCSITM